MTTSSLRFDLGRCIEYDKSIIQKLEAKIIEIEAYHTKQLAAKTTGTALTALGTIGGICLAPFTMGASLVITAAGIGLGTATNVITDFVNMSETEQFLDEINEIVQKKNQAFDDITLNFETLESGRIAGRKLGLSETFAYYLGIACCTMPAIQPDKLTLSSSFVKAFQTFAKSSSAETIAIPLSVATVATVVGHSLKATGKSSLAVANLSALGKSAGKIAGRAVSIAAVAFTVVDTVNLINEWKSNHPVTESIKTIIKDLEFQTKQLQDFVDLLIKMEREMSQVWFYSSLVPFLPPVLLGNPKLVDDAVILTLQDWDTYYCTLVSKSGITFPTSNVKFITEFLIRYAVTEALESDAAKGRTEIHDILKLRGKKAKENIKKWFKELLDRCKREWENRDKKKDKKRKRGDHVINNSVLNIYRDIVSAFVQQLNGKDFTDAVYDGQIGNDMREPVEPRIKYNIQELMVAYFYEGESRPPDVNAGMYGRGVEILRTAAVNHMKELYEELHRRPTLTPGTGTRFTAHIQESVRQMNNGPDRGEPLYVDIGARERWMSSQPGNVVIYQNTVPSVKNIFDNLYDKLSQWVREFKRLEDTHRF